MKELNIEDFYRIKFLSDVQTFGKKIFFVVSNADKKSNEYRSKIWIYDGKIQEFTSGPKDSQPRVSPDGKFLAFVSQRKEKKNQLMLMPLTGGEPKVILERDDISEITWAPDGKSIYFISNEKMKSESDVRYIERYPFYFNGKGFIFDKRPVLFKVNLRGKVKKITDEPYNVVSFSISKDNKIAVVMRDDKQDVYWNNLYIFENGKMKKIEIDGSFSNPRFSPDGEKIAVVYSDNKKSIFQHHKIYIYNLQDDSFKCITDDIDRDIGNSINSDSRFGSGKLFDWVGERIYFTVTDGGISRLFYHDEKGNIEFFSNNESIECFSIMEKGFAYISQSATRPTELFLYNGKIKRLTKFNKYFESLTEPKKFTIKASDGKDVDFWFLTRDGKERPTILEIHGGPKTAYGNAFMFEFHILASSGFNVIFSNPRGSDGYSESFALEIKEHFGERDFMDLMEIVEYALKNLPVNKERLGVMGGSYGGFMTNWIIGHTDLFKAAITERSISNQISFFGTSDIGPGFNGDQIGKNPWDMLEHYWEKSPLKHVRNVKTPLLIIHSDEDYRCPIEQAYQLFTALRYYNKYVKMVIFPGENHDLSRSGKPKHRTERLKIILNFMKEHIGEEK